MSSYCLLASSPSSKLNAVLIFARTASSSARSFGPISSSCSRSTSCCLCASSFAIAVMSYPLCPLRLCLAFGAPLGSGQREKRSLRAAARTFEEHLGFGPFTRASGRHRPGMTARASIQHSISRSHGPTSSNERWSCPHLECRRREDVPGWPARGQFTAILPIRCITRRPPSTRHGQSWRGLGRVSIDPAARRTDLDISFAPIATLLLRSSELTQWGQKQNIGLILIVCLLSPLATAPASGHVNADDESSDRQAGPTQLCKIGQRSPCLSGFASAEDIWLE